MLARSNLDLIGNRNLRIRQLLRVVLRLLSVRLLVDLVEPQQLLYARQAALLGAQLCACRRERRRPRVI